MSIEVTRLEAQISADPAEAIAGLKTFDAAASASARDETKHIHVKIDESQMGKLKSGFDSVTNSSDRTEKSVSRVGQAAVHAGRGMKILRAGMMGVMAVGIYGLVTTLAGALSGLTATVGGLVGALGPLTGLLATLPVGLGAVLGGVGGVMLGLSGVGAGMKALSSATKGAAGVAVDYAAKARRVRDALHSLKKAEEDLAKARKDAAAAPQQAKDAIAQQHRDTTRAVLDEKGAILALQRAQIALQDAQNKSSKSGFNLTKELDAFTGKTYDVANSAQTAADAALDQEQAILDVKNAELSLADAKANTIEQTRKQVEMDNKGIKNSDIVKDANRQLADALWAVKLAQEAVTEAKKKDAAASSGASAWADAMKGLSATGQKFVRFMNGEFLPAFKKVKFAAQDGLLPGVQTGLTAIMGHFDGLAKVVGAFAKTVGDAFESLALFWSQDDRSKQLSDTFMGLNGTLGKMLKLSEPLSRVFAAITKAATPLTNTILDSLNKKLDKFANWSERNSGKNGKMQSFFGTTWKFMKLWGGVLGPIASLLGSVAKAAEPLATWMLKSMGDYFDDLAKKMKGVQGQKSMADWFNKQAPSIREFFGMIKDLSKVLFTSGAGGENNAFVETAKKIRKDVIPAFGKLLTTLDQSDFGPKLATLIKHVADFFSLLVKHDGVLSMIVGGINTMADALGRLSKITGGKSTSVLLAALTAYGLSKVGKGIGKKVGGVAKDITGAKRFLFGNKASGAHRAGEQIAERKNVVTRGYRATKGAVKRGGALAKGAGKRGADVARAVGRGASTMGEAAAKGAKAAGAAAGRGAAAFGRMTAAIAANIAKVVVWGATMAAQAVKAVAKMAWAAAKVVAKWVLMGVQATLQAGRMAAAWVISMGPVAWIIAAVIGLAILVYKNWDKIKKYTKIAWDWVWGKIKWFGDKVLFLFKNFTPAGLLISHFGRIKEGARKAFNWIMDKVDSVVGFFKKVPGRISGALTGIWDGLKNGLKSSLRWIIDTFNKLRIHIPGIGVGKFKTPEVNWSPNVPNPFRQFGGPVKKGESYVVGEKRPEMFVPTTSGRIMPKINTSAAGKGGGITDAQLERILRKVQEDSKPDVNIEQTFNEKVDPKHMSSELVWRMAS